MIAKTSKEFYLHLHFLLLIITAIIIYSAAIMIQLKIQVQ